MQGYCGNTVHAEKSNVSKTRQNSQNNMNSTILDIASEGTYFGPRIVIAFFEIKQFNIIYGEIYPPKYKKQ